MDAIRAGFAVVPGRITRRRLRSDSAAYEEKTLKWCNDPANHLERFTISADMSEQLHKLCEGVATDAWKPYEERAQETVWWSEVEFFPGDWEKMAKPLRTLVMKIQKRQGELFASGADRMYLGVVSNDFAEDGAKLLHWHYQKAGHIEVVHDVLKNELGAGVLPCGAFGANAAWFRLCLLTYNLLSAMKTLGLPPALCDARPKRLRFAVFNLAARITSHARRTYARVAAALGEAISLLTFRRGLGRLRCATAAPG